LTHIKPGEKRTGRQRVDLPEAEVSCDGDRQQLLHSPSISRRLALLAASRGGAAGLRLTDLRFAGVMVGHYTRPG
jgi:putative N-acetylmannosamine-6-phosphate epimerase